MYVKPDAKIFVLQLNENIADSVQQGDDAVSGLFVISFTQNLMPCRNFYSGIDSARNTLGMDASFAEYYAELQGYGSAELWGCMKLV